LGVTEWRNIDESSGVAECWGIKSNRVTCDGVKKELAGRLSDRELRDVASRLLG